MKKANKLYLLLLILTLYPVWMLLKLNTASVSKLDILQALIAYGISMWVGWLFFAGAAVYYKWTEKKNNFFYITYGYILIAYGFYGYFYQQAVLITDTSTRLSHGYSAGLFTVFLHIVLAAIVTAVLQLSVWWFTRKLHRE